MHKLVLGFIIVCLLIPHPASAQGMNTGIIYGQHHAFSLTAPTGWVLDNESGAPQGLHAVFYPIGSSWKASPAVIYARGIVRESSANTVKAQVELTLKDFKENGSPHISAQFIKDIKAEKEKKGSLYYFSGDKWGNHEAVAYFEEDKTINFIVLTSRTKEAFNSALKSFEELAMSYMFITEDVKIEKRK
jgi:hypothetical protein